MGITLCSTISTWK